MEGGGITLHFDENLPSDLWVGLTTYCVSVTSHCLAADSNHDISDLIWRQVSRRWWFSACQLTSLQQFWLYWEIGLLWGGESRIFFSYTNFNFASLCCNVRCKFTFTPAVIIALQFQTLRVRSWFMTAHVMIHWLLYCCSADVLYNAVPRQKLIKNTGIKNERNCLACDINRVPKTH